MKELLAKIDARTAAYGQLPLYAFMRDERISARERLAFIPCLAHFVMSFSDLYAHVLRDESAPDRFQELVNAHTYEDGGHWKWFLADLSRLDLDPTLRFTDSLRFLWSEETLKIRALSYRMCRLGLGASSLEKLILVHCIEATGRVSLEHSALVSRQLATRDGKPLVYFGAHHIDTESQHTLEDHAVHESLEHLLIEASLRPRLESIIDDAFDAFEGFAADVLAFAESKRSAATAVSGIR